MYMYAYIIIEINITESAQKNGFEKSKWVGRMAGRQGQESRIGHSGGGEYGKTIKYNV